MAGNPSFIGAAAQLDNLSVGHQFHDRAAENAVVSCK